MKTQEKLQSEIKFRIQAMVGDIFIDLREEMNLPETNATEAQINRMDFAISQLSDEIATQIGEMSANKELTKEANKLILLKTLNDAQNRGYRLWIPPLSINLKEAHVKEMGDEWVEQILNMYDYDEWQINEKTLYYFFYKGWYFYLLAVPGRLPIFSMDYCNECFTASSIEEMEQFIERETNAHKA